MWFVIAYGSIHFSGAHMAIIWIVSEDINRPIMVIYDEQLSQTTHVSAYESNSTLGLLLAAEA